MKILNEKILKLPVPIYFVILNIFCEAEVKY